VDVWPGPTASGHPAGASATGASAAATSAAALGEHFHRRPEQHEADSDDYPSAMCHRSFSMLRPVESCPGSVYGFGCGGLRTTFTSIGGTTSSPTTRSVDRHT